MVPGILLEPDWDFVNLARPTIVASTSKPTSKHAYRRRLFAFSFLITYVTYVTSVYSRHLS